MNDPRYPGDEPLDRNAGSSAAESLGTDTLGSEMAEADPDTEDLVAYLDGELPSQEVSRIEARLAEDEGFRNRLVDLQRSWDMLERLPRTRRRRVVHPQHHRNGGRGTTGRSGAAVAAEAVDADCGLGRDRRGNRRLFLGRVPDRRLPLEP